MQGLKTLRNRSTYANRDRLKGVESQSVRSYGIRADTSRLDDGERGELGTLAAKAGFGMKHEDGMDLTRLTDRERDRFEKLIGKSAGDAKLLQTRRETAAARGKLGELAAQARRPARRGKLEEAGSVHLPREWVWDLQRDGVLDPWHLGLLVYLEACFENGECLTPGVRMTVGDGQQVLHVDRLLGLIGGFLDPDSAYSGWERAVNQLERNAFIEVKKRGKDWEIRRGRRSLDARETR
jgi:hypothetical protein